MLRWSQIWRWHFRYTATIELTHNPTGSTKDVEPLRTGLETGIRQLQLPEGYRVAGVKVQFKSEDDSVHLEGSEEGRDLTRDTKLLLVIAVAALGAIGVLFEKMTWAEAGGIIGTVVAAYIAAAAVQQAIVQLARR